MHNAPSLREDSDLISAAQRWADTLASTCSGLRHDDNRPSDQGENLFACGFSSDEPCASADGAVRSWYDEVALYSDGMGFTNETGHFTQVVWKSTTAVGCADSAPCTPSDNEDFNWQYVVCRYSPPGNVNGQFSQNV
ncbi:unnamed protein product, partial [Discosporangium mesarthrocarpum]